MCNWPAGLKGENKEKKKKKNTGGKKERKKKHNFLKKIDMHLGLNDIFNGWLIDFRRI